MSDFAYYILLGFVVVLLLTALYLIISAIFEGTER